MENTRGYWLETLNRIAFPVLDSMAAGTLQKDMPIRGVSIQGKETCTYLEALGRTLCGISPWLELEGVRGEEKELQRRYRELAQRALARAVDPEDPARLNFSSGGQPLVDAAFLAEGILRAPNVLWRQLPEKAKTDLVNAMVSTRSIRPGHNNWLCFSATVEAFLHMSGAGWQHLPVDYALNQLDQWYLGDGVYGDGKMYAWDYYNSYVIHPMLLDVTEEFRGFARDWDVLGERFRARASRYCSHLERMIMPDGTYPVIGRSSAYRFGAFHALAQGALMDNLPPDISPASVRRALTAVIRRVMSGNNFDDGGWLLPGITGHQPSIGETYISTGSLYLCCFIFLPLGLPENDRFWADPDEPFSQEKIWGGEDIQADHAVH